MIVLLISLFDSEDLEGLQDFVVLVFCFGGFTEFTAFHGQGGRPTLGIGSQGTDKRKV